MRREKSGSSQKRLGVSVQSVASADAKERRRRAVDLLLQAAARDSQSKESRNSRLAQHQCKRKNHNRQASTPSDATEDILAADNAEMNNANDTNVQNL